MRIIVKEVGKEAVVEDTTEKYCGNCVRKYFEDGTYVQRCYLEGLEFVMAVDEEGIMKDLPVNFYLPLADEFLGSEAIRGTAVFVRNHPCDIFGKEVYDYEVKDVTDEDIQLVKMFMDTNIQAELAAKNRFPNGIVRFHEL